jgi:predicted amidohydrolase YtcJ
MELLVEDATFVTMAAQAGPAEAMLVRDGRIAAIGPAGQVRAAAGRPQVVRLDGATVIPGLIDAHCHVTDVGYLAAAADCSQPSAPGIEAIKARLREAAGRTPDGSWVTGGGYAEYKLRENRHPTRADLDQAVPGRPAVLYHTSLHACVLNTAALREAGFADAEPDPPGGAFGRDREGRLDGVVYEAPMFALFARNLHRDLARTGDGAGSGLIEAAGRKLSSFGISSACDADLRRDTFAAFAAADAAGRLRQRIYGLIVHDQTGTVPRGRHSGRLATEAVKIWADGGMSSRTAAIGGTYPVPPYGSGILSFERDELTAMVRDFDARGFQVCIHAQGDRAIETVLDAYAAVLYPRSAAGGGNPRRHRIEHGGAMYSHLTERAAALGIVIASQPGFLSGLGDGFAAAFPDRCDELYAFASWRRAGLTVAGSSDSPVITADPRVGIRDAILRRTGDGRVLGPGERLSAREALALYTTQAAIACHRENEIGSLEPGKLADFTVLDGNPLETEPELIPGLAVLATVLDGTPVYQSGSIFPGG